MNIAKILEEKAGGFSQKPAIIFKDKSISFSQLRDDTFKLADSLRKLGIKKGDKVAIYLPSWPECSLSYLSLFCLGATAVPLDFALTMDELVSCLSHSETKLLIAKSKEEISFPELKNKVKTLKDMVLCHEKKEDFLSFEELINAGNAVYPGIDISPDDYGVIMYTSGSTGRPKGVIKTYRNLESAPQAMVPTINMTDKDILINCLPFSHDGGFIYIQALIYYGATLIIMERFIPVEFLKNVQDYRVTFFWLVPAMYYALLHNKEFEKFDLTSLTRVLVFGAPSSPDMLRRFHQYCPNAAFLNGWGMTETMGPTIVLPVGSENLASIGKPLPWVSIRIVDEFDKEVSAGSVGELAIKSWCVMAGYYKDPEETSRVMKGGWLHTGDLARIDNQGFVYIVGRKKEMIKVAGEIVFEPEVESAIMKHPDIAEAAVIGVPDKLRGEVPKAFVVLKEGKDIDEDALRYFCREHLAHFKIPRYFQLTGSLPKNRAGKIDKEVLRSQK